MSRPNTVPEALARLIPLRLAEWFADKPCGPILTANVVDLEPAMYSHFVGGDNRSGVAAVTTGVQLVNPDNSGLILLIDKLDITAHINTEIVWRRNAARFGVQTRGWTRDLRRVTGLDERSDITFASEGVAFSGANYAGNFLQAGIMSTFDNLRYIVPAGRNISLFTRTDQVNLDFTWYWREISVNDFNLTAFDEALKRF